MHRLSELTRAAYGVESSVHDATREVASKETVSRIGREQLLKLRSALGSAHRVIRDVSLPKIWLESELIRVATAPAEPTPAPQVSPKPETQAVAAPPKAPSPKPEAKAAVSAAPATAPKQDLRLASDDPKWAKVVAAVRERSAALAMRLMDVQVQSQTEELLTLEFRRETELLWILDNPQKLAMVREKVAEIYGKPLEVECAVASKNGTPELAEPAAVELPLQGAALHQAAKSLLVEDPGANEEQS